ncbi:MAG UNVERIFIED_CONTAM: hypothetical protein LVR18_16850 [Planctomycetaceae bacterium]
MFTKLSAKKKAEQEMCHCTNCCDAETMQTLAKTAYEIKSNGCCYEPSLRVRKMAVEAIAVCGIPCNFGPYQAEEIAPAPAGEVKPIPEETPPPVKGTEQAPAPNPKRPRRPPLNQLQSPASNSSASSISLRVEQSSATARSAPSIRDGSTSSPLRTLARPSSLLRKSMLSPSGAVTRWSG